MPNSFKRLTLFLLCFITLQMSAFAQGDKLSIAKQFLHGKEIEALRLSAEDVADPAVRQTFSKQSQVSNFYFQQRYHGIEVQNAVLNVHVTKDDQILTYGSRFLTGLSGRINATAPVLKPVEAILMAAQELGYTDYKETPVLRQDNGGDARETVFEGGSLSSSDIPVKLVYQPLEDGSVKLCWQVTIDEPQGKHWWMARIDAQTGKLLDKNDLIVSCYFGETEAEHAAHTSGKARTGNTVYDNIRNAEKLAAKTNDFSPTDGSSYRVYAPVVESPNFGARTLVSDPADATASPYGWHDTNGADGAEFTITRGNNVYAQIDNDNNNLTFGFAPDGGPSLDFDYAIDFTQAPSTYQSAAVTNLFFWNNYMHDFSYRYGFDEASGNFQVNNYGRGGAGNDLVIADAQDSGGTNNANFGTPADGSSPRMQMYLWTNTSPQRDGDLDNGVIAHEYTHGISNRLTGGPANVNCLNNNEQMGEGWSDWFGLMATIEPGDHGTDSRGIGTYVLGQAPNDVGIRPTPYSTNMAINPVTYNSIKTAAIPHGVGYVWCGMIWDLTWALIDLYGMNTGYEKAMMLVTEGMKLQPCSPGFVDGRNAILAADQALYGGENKCLIWEVFARRGLGFSATQGSSSSTTDGVQAFDTNPICDMAVTPSTLTVCSTENTATFKVNLGASFTGSYTLSMVNPPAGSTQQFSPASITNADTSTLTISNLGAVAQGTYGFAVKATNGSNIAQKSVSLKVYNPVASLPVLVSPANGSDVPLLTPTFSWDAAINAEMYELQVASDNGFSNIVYSNTGISATSISISTVLTSNTQYFWRVKGKNYCGSSNYSSVFSFTTPCISCNATVPSTNVPIAISASGTPTITSTLFISDMLTITDVNLINLNVTHSWIDDLDVDLISPKGTVIRMMNRPCAGEDNILINLDDQAASGSFPCPPTNNGTYKPFAPLAGFNGELSRGVWTLRIHDNATADGGSLNQWGLQICGATTFFRDADNDGYGNIDDFTVHCTAPSGYVADYTDCNDNNTNINPGKSERCNGIDDNCNGQIDEGTVPVTLSAVATDVSCFGLANGSVNLTVNTAAAPPAFQWSNNASTEDISGLVIGAYNVTVTGADGCTGTTSSVVNQPATALSVSATSTAATCPSANGAIDITASGGALNYQYLWNDNSMLDDRSALASGSYTVTVTDGHNCVTSTSVTVGIIDVTAPDIVCKNIVVYLNSGGAVTLAPSDVYLSGMDNCSSVTPQSVSPTSFACGDIGSHTVTLTASDENGNTATCTASVSVQDNTAPQVICKNATVVLNGSGSGSASASDVFQSGSDNCSSVTPQSVSPSSFACGDIGPHTVTLTAADGSSNTGTCTATITVEDHTSPQVVCKNANVVLNGSGAASISVSDVFQSGSDICSSVTPVSVSPSSFSCADVGQRTVTLTAADASSNTATCTATITVQDQTSPQVVCKNANVVLNGSGAGSISAADVFQSGSDICSNVTPVSVSPSSFSCADIGQRTVTLTASDGSSNTGTCTATITVEDHTAPQVVCKNANVVLNGSGAASISVSDVFQSGSDICSSVTPVSVSPSSFSCADVGQRTVTLTASDGSSNTGTCTATITVQDHTAPQVVCKDANVVLNGSGAGSISTADVFQSGSDLCSNVTPVSVSPSSFTCADIGERTVTLTATDGSSNTGTCTASITIKDQTAPQVVCKNAIVVLNGSGAASVSTADVFQSGSDLCSSVTPVSVSPSSFSCGDIGQHTVTLTAADGSSNTGTCTATVTVQDNSAPVIVCKNITANLNTSGSVTITAASVYLSSTDNCTVTPQSVTPSSFTCSNLGQRTVTLTASDASGNTGTCTATVTVQDNSGPTLVCKDATVVLNAAGTGSITALAIYQSGSDNCSGTINLVGASPASFTCANVGLNIVTLTANDGHGNTGTCNANVTVVDNRIPNITCPPSQSKPAGFITVPPPVAMSDNCSIDHYEARKKSGSNWTPWVSVAPASPSPLTGVYTAGTYTMQYQAVDPSGLLKICQFTLTVSNSARTSAPEVQETEAVTFPAEKADASEADALMCYPNPFSGELTIRFALHEKSDVHLSISNIAGVENTILADDTMTEGEYLYSWNPAKQSIPSGVYVVRLEVGNNVYFKRVIYF